MVQKWDCPFKRKSGSMVINASTNKRYKGIKFINLTMYETEQNKYAQCNLCKLKTMENKFKMSS